MTIPASYNPAKWHCTLPTDPSGDVGIGFEMADGQLIRLRLPSGSARHLFETLGEQLTVPRQTKAPGLYYRRQDSHELRVEGAEIWMIRIDPDDPDGPFQFRRYVNGMISNSYAPMHRGRAAIAASAIIQGFEPPRFLCHRGTPAQQIQAEQT